MWGFSMRYNTVLFDADGTLFDFLRCEDEALRDTLRGVGITPSDELVADYSVINDSLWKMLERGEIEKSVLLYRRFEIFCEKHGFVCDAKKMAKDYTLNLAEKAYLIDGAEALCARLDGKVRMYIVTNGVEYTQKRRYAKSGLERYFSGVFISGEIGYEKPSREYFDKVAQSIPDFNVADTLIVGDSLTSDIKGGINYGIDTCWYDPEGKTAPDDMKITRISRDYADIYEFITGEGKENV